MASAGYYQFEREQVGENLQFYFISIGNRKIVKVVEYSYAGCIGNKKVFNLGFGDYDIQTGIVDDKANTANGDVFKVFNTVLHITTLFFESFPDAMLVVAGSDSDPLYVESCRKDCRKRCEEECRNSGRRIAIYRAYINKNIELIRNDFYIFGSLEIMDAPEQVILEAYTVNKKYNSVFLAKK